MKKIFIIANHYHSIRIFRRELINSLLMKDVRLTIIVPEFNDKFIDELKSKGVTFVFLKMKSRGLNPLNEIILLSKLLKIIRTSSPDIILTYTIKLNFYVGLIRYFKKYSFFPNVTGLGSFYHSSSFNKFLVTLLYKFSLNKTDLVITENSSIQSYLINVIKCKNVLLLNGAGVNTSYFHYIDYPTTNLTQFLYLGRFLKDKGIYELLKAIKIVSEKGYTFNFHFVGNGSKKISDEIHKMSKNGNIFVHGYTLDVKPFLTTTSCLVHPSHHEGMANVILEASSVGRPSIASNIPGCKESVIDGVTGFLFEKENESDIASAMIKMIKLSNETRAEMGKKARLNMINNFNKEQIVKKTLSAIGLD